MNFTEYNKAYQEQGRSQMSGMPFSIIQKRRYYYEET